MPGVAVSRRRALQYVNCLDTTDTMDDELLAAPRQAQERLIEAEHDAEVARAEFHRAVAPSACRCAQKSSPSGWAKRRRSNWPQSKIRPATRGPGSGPRLG